jgi:RNA recognition motif-containing protein
MPKLLFANLPHDCSEREVEHWVESFGFKIGDLRIVRDLVAGVSPAFAYVSFSNERDLAFAQTALDGKMLRTRRLVVRKVNSGPALFPGQSSYGRT